MNKEIKEAMKQRVETTLSLGMEAGQVWLVQFKKKQPAVRCGIDSVCHESNCVAFSCPSGEGLGGTYSYGMRPLSDIRVLKKFKDLRWQEYPSCSMQ